MSNKNSSRLPGGSLVFLFALALTASAALPAHGEEFTATLVDLEGGGSTSIVIRIDQYSTDGDVKEFKALLAERGQDALRDALWDHDEGHIRVGDNLGYPIAAARQQGTSNGRVVRVWIVRPLSFRELISGARSTDYPFTRIELNLDHEGKGEGEMIAAVKVSLEGDTLEIESYTARPLKLLNVRQTE